MMLNHVLYSAVNILNASALHCLIANLQNYMDDLFALVHIQSHAVLAQNHAHRVALFGTWSSIITFKITGFRLFSWARWIQCAQLHPVSHLCTQSVNHIVRGPCVFSSVCSAQIWEPVRKHFGSPRTSVSYQVQTVMERSKRAAYLSPSRTQIPPYHCHSDNSFCCVVQLTIVLYFNWQAPSPEAKPLLFKARLSLLENSNQFCRCLHQSKFCHSLEQLHRLSNDM